MTKILITGASGLIGSEICRVLNTKNIDFITTHFQNESNWNSAESIRLDLRSSESFDRLMSLDMHHVVHSAAIIPGRNGITEIEAHDQNRKIDDNILKVCEKKDISLTYLSSTSVYGFPREKLAKEGDGSVIKLSPYSEGKLRTEKNIQKRGIAAKILRINAPYGLKQSAKTVLKIFIENALFGKDLLYYGTGSRKQDFTYAGDIANLIVNSIPNPAKGVFNISAGQPISMFDLAYLVRSLVKDCKSEIQPSGVPDIQESHMANYDISKAKEFLGWNPQTELRKGIKLWINTIMNEAGNNI